jgi:hypothetical protein
VGVGGFVCEASDGKAVVTNVVIGVDRWVTINSSNIRFGWVVGVDMGHFL